MNLVSFATNLSRMSRYILIKNMRQNVPKSMRLTMSYVHPLFSWRRTQLTITLTNVWVSGRRAKQRKRAKKRWLDQRKGTNKASEETMVMMVMMASKEREQKKDDLIKEIEQRNGKQSKEREWINNGDVGHNGKQRKGVKKDDSSKEREQRNNDSIKERKQRNHERWWYSSKDRINSSRLWRVTYLQ